MARIQELYFSLALILLLVADAECLSGWTCFNHGGCGRKECCTGYLLNEGRGTCISRMALGQQCKPLILPGLEDCPCEIGLTCARSTSEHDNAKFHCQKLKNLVLDEHNDDANLIKHV